LILKDPSNEACLADLAAQGTSKETLVSKECVQGDGRFDQLFAYKPTGNWYVVLNLENRYPSATILRFNQTFYAKAHPNRQDMLNFVKMYVQGMQSATQEKSAKNEVHLVSPAGEVSLGK